MPKTSALAWCWNSSWELGGIHLAFPAMLSAAERLYSMFNRELLTAYSAVCHFPLSIEGRCTIFTDHQPLAQAVQHTSDPWSSQQQRHLSDLAEFVVDVIYLPSSCNTSADALSCSSVSSVSLGVHFSWLAMSNAPLLKTGPCGLPSLDSTLLTSALFLVENKDITSHHNTLLCDLSMGVPRPVVPSTASHHIFDLLHGLSHPGVRSSQWLMGDQFIWFSMR